VAIVSSTTSKTAKPVLIGYMPPLEGIDKTRANYAMHSSLINIGDLVYTYAGALLCGGDDFIPWNFSLTAEEVNERCSQVIFFIPCRIAPPPYDDDGYPFELVTQFIEKLTIPFTSISESVQSTGYDYSASLHKELSPKVIRYLHTIADHSVVVGTRGEYSADILKRLGISNVEPVGCLSLYLNGPQLSPKLAMKRPFSEVEKVTVAYSNYQNNKQSRIKDILQLAIDNGCHYVEQSFNLLVKALYYPGMIDAFDVHQATQFYLGLNQIQQLFEQNKVHYFTNYSIWKDFLGEMDFVFGARMHGLTPAIHAGVPALFIAHDARVREMCEFFDLPFIAEQDLPQGADLTIENLYSRTDYQQTSQTYPLRYQAFLSFLTKNGIAANVKQDGQIHNYWQAKPSLSVLSSESVRSPITATDADFFSKICQAGLNIPDEYYESFKQAGSLGKDWYKSRIK